MDIFLLGCVGGLLAYIITFALPVFRQMYELQAFDLTLTRIIGAIGIGVGLIVIGGLAAWGFSDDQTTSKDAFIYGVAGEALFAGVIRSAAGSA